MLEWPTGSVEIQEGLGEGIATLTGNGGLTQVEDFFTNEGNWKKIL